jgi:hypothetical protein
MSESWVDKKFNFDYPYILYSEFIRRLKETPDHLELLIHGVDTDKLKMRDGDNWSIQENIGHLLTTDDLFSGRLDDYEAGSPTLRPADLTGKRTYKINYNFEDVKDILIKFRNKRMVFILRLENVDQQLFEKSAWHPRLDVKMRLCDMLYFQAEHDEHHIKKIETLIKKR